MALLTSGEAAAWKLAGELERQGQPVTVVVIGGPRGVDAPADADVVRLPMLSPGIAASFAMRILREPGRLLRLALRHRTLLRLPLAVHVAQLVARRGIGEVRAEGPLATKVAAVVRELTGPTHADLSDLPVDWQALSPGRDAPLGVRWIVRRINSIAAEVSVGGRRVVVKRQRSHRGGSAADRWAHELAVLRRLGDAMTDGHLGVPQVLQADEAAALIVMERAPGVSLDAMFAERSDGLDAAIEGAGAWLAAMQRVSVSGQDGAALLDRIVGRAVEDAALLASKDGAFRRRQRAIVRGIERLRQSVAKRPLRVTGHHDDYWPGNIFFDGTRVSVIDFESFRDGFPLEDAAYFLLRAELLQRRFRVPLPDLAARFFIGYGAPADDEALRLFTLTKGLRSLANGMGEDLPAPQRIWTRRTMRNALMRALL